MNFYRHRPQWQSTLLIIKSRTCCLRLRCADFRRYTCTFSYNYNYHYALCAPLLVENWKLLAKPSMSWTAAIIIAEIVLFGTFYNVKSTELFLMNILRSTRRDPESTIPVFGMLPLPVTAETVFLLTTSWCKHRSLRILTKPFWLSISAHWYCLPSDFCSSFFVWLVAMREQ